MTSLKNSVTVLNKRFQCVQCPRRVDNWFSGLVPDPLWSPTQCLSFRCSPRYVVQGMRFFLPYSSVRAKKSTEFDLFQQLFPIKLLADQKFLNLSFRFGLPNEFPQLEHTLRMDRKANEQIARTSSETRAGGERRSSCASRSERVNDTSWSQQRARGANSWSVSTARISSQSSLTRKTDVYNACLPHNTREHHHLADLLVGLRLKQRRVSYASSLLGKTMNAHVPA